MTDDTGQIFYSDQYDFESIINCAYDPNDKLVEPDDFGAEENFTLFEDVLTYTVRFQNTGTDTAFNIKITDQLDGDLDLTTFRPLSSSHPYEVFLHESGALEFAFRNILLPDSTTNEIASHGFVKYQIESKTELAENTVVENFANIFFDFNPPIITNTTINTLVSELPTNTKDIFHQAPYVKVFPNPFQQWTKLSVVDLENKNEYGIQLIDLNGKKLQYYPLEGVEFVQIDRRNLPAGIYFYQLIHQINGSILEVGKVVAQ